MILHAKLRYLAVLPKCQRLPVLTPWYFNVKFGLKDLYDQYDAFSMAIFRSNSFNAFF